MANTLAAVKCGSCARTTLDPSGYCHDHQGVRAAARTTARYTPPPPPTGARVEQASTTSLSAVVPCHKCVNVRTRHVSGLCHADRSTASAGELSRATEATARAYPELLPVAARTPAPARKGWVRKALGL